MAEKIDHEHIQAVIALWQTQGVDHPIAISTIVDVCDAYLDLAERHRKIVAVASKVQVSWRDGWVRADCVAELRAALAEEGE
jgi:hypothetical protein